RTGPERRGDGRHPRGASARPARRHDRGAQRRLRRRLGDEPRLHVAAAGRPVRPLRRHGDVHGDRTMGRARAAGLACSTLACLALVPAAAGASAPPPPPIALTAAPAHVLIEGSGEAAVRVANYGATPLVVDVARAGFALDVRGRPRVVTRGDRRTAVGWIAVRPRSLALRPGEARPLTVAAALPPRAEPGDHDALLLLTTRPRRRGGVAVRMRVGIVVVVRAPGRIVHRLELRALRLVRVAARARIL